MNIDIPKATHTHTDTISWFIVNPGAKERLVQITGTSEDKIQYVLVNLCNKKCSMKLSSFNFHCLSV